jgi:ribosomal protein S12 methylthiotransferase
MYLHPQRVSEDVIDLLARQRRLCPYVDLPLQHINDRVLRQMGRRTARKDIVRLISELRKKVASIALRTTFIVGFLERRRRVPRALDFVRETRFDKHGGLCSPGRKNAGTTLITAVPQKEKQKTLSELMEMQKGFRCLCLKKRSV